MSELAHRGPFAGSWSRLTPTRRMQAVLVAYGVVLAAVAVSAFDSRAAAPIMTSRSQDVAASIAVLDQGGPPLLASDVPYHAGIEVTHLRPVGVTDDQGIYLYLPLLSKLTGEQDPNVLMKWLFMGCFGLLLLVFPLLFYELFGSIVVAVAAPLLALWKFAFTQTLDLYWIRAWCMLLCIPGLVLAYQWWSSGRRRAAVIVLVLLMLAASFSTSIRIHAGVPIVLGGLGIVAFAGASPPRERRALLRFWHLPRWWVRPAIAAGLVLAYLSIATFGFAAVRAYRNHVIHQPSFGSNWPTQHPFWHNAYIGLGYLPNKYGIQWSDTVSADAVQRDRPGTGFLTKEYESTLRHRYFSLLGDDPGFVIRNLWTKARVLVADAVSRFWLAFLLLPAAVLTGVQRRSMRFAVLVGIVAAVVGALAPLLTIPELQYQLAWLGTWGALFLLAIGWAWVTATRFFADVPPELEPLRRRPDPVALAALRERLGAARWAWALAAALLVTVVLGATARPAPEPSSSGLYQSLDAPFVDAALLDRPALASWRFDGALAKGWTTGSGAFVERDNGETAENGLYVRSNMVTSEDDLVGPPVELPAGKYQLVGGARALVGGFQLSVRKDDGTAVATAGYSTLQTEFLQQAIAAPFTLASATRVHVFVAAWSSFPNASAWVLWRLKLVRA